MVSDTHWSSVTGGRQPRFFDLGGLLFVAGMELKDSIPENHGSGDGAYYLEREFDMNVWMRRSAGVVVIAAGIMAAGATAAQADDDYQSDLRSRSEATNVFRNETNQPIGQISFGDGSNFASPRNTTVNRQDARSSSRVQPIDASTTDIFSIYRSPLNSYWDLDD